MRDKGYFAEWLNRTLLERGIAGGEVARALGVNDSAISKWRNGKATPALESIMALAEHLDVHPLRLAVTAGLMSSNQAGVERLDLPEDTKTRAMVKDQIASIRGTTAEERQAMLDAYDRLSSTKVS